MTKASTNFEAAKKFVERKRRHGQESLSGPGSWIENTHETVSLVNDTIKKFGVTSVLDLGCGDWNWFKRVERCGVDYEGWDADERMTQSLSQTYGGPHTRFFVKDVVLEEFPKADLYICRDVLFHMTAEFATVILDKIRKKGGLLIATSFRDMLENTMPRKYTTFDNWGFYKINLNIEPFCLAGNEINFLEEENISKPNRKRYICLFDFR